MGHMGKRGRKKKPGKREPNGQLSRQLTAVATRLRDALDKDERDTISIGVEARERIWGVPANDARDQMAGSFIGRLCMSKELSPEQYEAAQTWAEEADANLWAIGAPPRMGAIDLNRVHGNGNAPENVARAHAVRTRYIISAQVVQARQNELRGTAALFAALQYLVMEDKPLHHLVPDLRCVLNALAKHYGSRRLPGKSSRALALVGQIG